MKAGNSRRASVMKMVFCIPFAIFHGVHELTYELIESVVLDYIPFIVLLLGLFVVTGGIAVKGLIAGTTRNNVLMLVVGTLLSSWIGTTGSAMLLIRPLGLVGAWLAMSIELNVRGILFLLRFQFSKR